MRVYTEEQLDQKSKEQLRSLLDAVKTNIDLTIEEKEANIDKINIALNGGVRYGSKEILSQIEAGVADIDDIN